VIAVVEHERFTGVRPASDHPNGGICIKGYSAPEIIYSPDRLLEQLRQELRGEGPQQMRLAVKQIG
jgi:anaerobic selenocysteine-containing dehydrogenase